MFTIDPASLALANVLVSLSLAAVLLVSRLGIGAEGRGIRTWVLGDLALTGARILAALTVAGSVDSPAPGFPVAPGCLVALGVVAHFQAIRKVGGSPVRPAAVAAQGLTLALLFYLALWAVDTLDHRIRLFDGMMLCGAVATLWASKPLLHFWGGRLVAMTMALAFLAQCARLAAWLLGVDWELQPEAVQQLRHSVNPLPLILDLVVGLFTTAGFALLIQERLRKRIERLVVTDALTGSLNRHGIMPLLKGALNQAQRHGRPVSVVMFDLDHFKRINDQHGHATGDQVLAGFASHVGAQLRESDQLSRWGGEEFLLLMADTERDTAHAVAERLRESVSQTPMDGEALRVTVSAGVASFEEVALQGQAPSARALLELLDTADRRLYLAKKVRNCVVSAEPAEVAAQPG